MLVTVLALSVLAVGVSSQPPYYPPPPSVPEFLSSLCDACIKGRCYEKELLLGGFSFNSIAIDEQTSMLYIHSHGSVLVLEKNPAQMKRIQKNNVTAMAVDRTANVIYTVDEENKLYSHRNTNRSYVKEYLGNVLTKPNAMFYKNHLYYAGDNVLYVIKGFKDNEHEHSVKLDGIRNFVVDNNGVIYFVSPKGIFKLKNIKEEPEILVPDLYDLVIGPDNVLYVGDYQKRVIYKWDSGKEALVPHAVYKTGHVEDFVIDSRDRIIFHDIADGNLYQWSSRYTQCVTYAPKTTYSVTDLLKDPDFCFTWRTRFSHNFNRY